MQSSRYASLMGYGVIAALVIAVFFPVIFGEKIVAPTDIQESFIQPWSKSANGQKPHNHQPSDAITQYIPYRVFAAKSFKEDGYLGWNPYEMGGFNMAGNTMALPGCWTTQLHRFLPFGKAWNYSICFQFLIAGAGMFTFLRSRKLNIYSCMIGTLAFMGNSQFIIWINHRWALGSFCWMPWVLWASTFLKVEGNKFDARVCLLPIFVSLAFLGGSIQHMIFVTLACGCMVLGYWQFWNPLKNNWRIVFQWFIVFTLVLGLLAFTLVPQLHAYFINVEIGHVRGSIGYKHGVLQPLYSLLAIPAQVWPWLMGDPQTIDASKALKLGYMNIAYWGSVPMILAYLGLFKNGMPKSAKWLIVLGIGIPLTPLVGPLYHRVQLLAILGGAWMVAEVTHGLYADKISLKNFKYVLYAVAAIGGVLCVFTVLPDSYRNTLNQKVVSTCLAVSDSSQFGSDEAWISDRANRWFNRFSLFNSYTLWVYGLLLIGVTSLALLVFKVGNKKTILSLLSLIVCAELGTFYVANIKYSDLARLRPNHPEIEIVEEAAKGGLVFQGRGVTSIGSLFAPPNILASYLVPSLDAYESIQYKSRWVCLNTVDPSTRLSLSGVSVVLNADGEERLLGTENWISRRDIDGFELLINPSAISEVIGIHCENERPISPEDLLITLLNGESIETIHKTMNRLSFVLPEGVNWIRIGQNWHRGWKWRVDGENQWRPVHQFEDGACWINTRELTTAGERVEIRFDPRPKWALVITTVSVFVYGLLTVILIKMKFK